MSSPDEIILQSLKSGNAKAFERLFREHYSPLVRFAFRFMKQEEPAEGAVQEVFTSLWEKRENIRISTSLKSYLYTSVRNHCLNKIKHSKVRQSYLEQFEGNEPVIESIINDLEAGELKDRISAAIGALPDRCREIFELSRFNGLRYKEIAGELGISPKTVEVQMGKALRLLREHLKDYLVLLIAFLVEFLN